MGSCCYDTDISSSGDIGPILSPSQYTKAAIGLFIADHNPWVTVIFLVGLFCMIFTTLDTLLLTVLQLGFHIGSRIVRRKYLSVLLLCSIIFSTQIPSDGVSAIGVFVASLLIIPFSAILRDVVPLSLKLLPDSNSYFLPSIALSLVGFVLAYDKIETDFSRHHLIPGIVLASVLISLSGFGLVKALVGLRRRYVD